MIFHWYGFFIGLGIYLGLLLVTKIQEKLKDFNRKYNEINLENLALLVFLPALVMARVYHVIDFWQYYKENFLKIIFVWEGGLAIYGAIIGGVLGVIIYSVKKFGKKWKLYTLISLDLLSFGTVLAQSIGRIGNFVNQELYGLPTNLAWGINIKKENRVKEYINFDKFHPLFLYEMVLNLTLLIFLVSLAKKKRKKGFYFFVYLSGYGTIRFILDFLRIEPWKWGSLTAAQWFSLGLIILSAGYFLKERLKESKIFGKIF